MAPILLFVYKRLETTKKVVSFLLKNELAENSKIFIFSDGSKNDLDYNKVKEVRKFIRNIKGFKEIEIIERNKNYGLARSIIDGVTQIINDYGKVIVLEDDLITSPYFLKYMNEALEIYKNEERVGAICSNMYLVRKSLPETFFLNFFDSWGWGTWKDKWELFNSNALELLKEIKDKKLEKDFDFNNSYFFTQLLELQSLGIVNSWAIRWQASLFLSNKLCLFPQKSLVKNIGFEKEGSNTKTSLGGIVFTSNFDKGNNFIKVEKINVEENLEAKQIVVAYFKQLKIRIIVKMMKVRNYLKILKKKLIKK